MVGIILCGHGRFASGMESALSLIAGDTSKFSFIDFEEGMTASNVFEKYQKTIEEWKEFERVIIMTDLPGGTPFNQAVYMAEQMDKVNVLSGTNLSMLLEIMCREELADESIIDEILQVGMNSVISYETQLGSVSDEDE